MTRHRRSGVNIAVALFLCLASAAGTPDSFVNKLRVLQLELAYRLDGGGLKARVTLATGEAIDFEVAEPAVIDRVLRIAQIFSSGATLFAEVQDRKVKSLDLAMPNVSLPTR